MFSPQAMSTEGRADDAPESWVGYSWYLVKKAGYGTYCGKNMICLSSTCYTTVYVSVCSSVAHYLGGKLAHLFGVTSPDWQYAIDIHEDMEREAREEREEEERAFRHLQE